MALPPGEQRDRDKLAASFIHRTGLASPTIWTSCHLWRWSVFNRDRRLPQKTLRR